MLALVRATVRDRLRRRSNMTSPTAPTRRRGAAPRTVLSSIVTTNVGSVLQNFLGTNTFSTSVPAGSYLYVAIYRTDANGAMAVLNLNARCKAELYK